ncbi:MAG: hypothetical protein V4709_02290 [Pseudomonadota bacterium]
MRIKLALGLLVFALAGIAEAAPAPFDLAGPALEVMVTRGDQTLAIAEVPNLAEGDQLRVKADLPATQSADYLLVVAFLRGSTNPPPEKWFFSCKTWKKKDKCNREGMSLMVPEGAQQVILFLAPSTGGDFDTLVSAVRGRPGAFVRTAQDLNQATLDRARLQRYLNTVQLLDQTNPAGLKTIAPLLARSLAIRVDEKCLDRLAPLQAPCLMSGQESLILADGHSRSIVETLTSSPGTDLLMQVSATPEGGYGYYSPYILSVIDIARILDSFTTARYQYIPALASASGSRLALTLNTAPSFHSPKSVLVAALPAIEAPQLPPLHAVEPDGIYCASQANLVLPVEGAPLVFATDYAHGLKLWLTAADGSELALPARADGTQGGYVIDTTPLSSAKLGDAVRATLKGYWGFTPYVGPSFQLRNAHASAWTVAPGDENALVVGRSESVHLRADSVACIDRIMARDPAGKELRAEWKKLTPGEVELQLPLQTATPGPLTLLISQHGAAAPTPLSVQTFAEVARLERFTLHAGDAQGFIIGSRLDEIVSVEIGDLVFLPGELSTQQSSDRLSVFLKDSVSASFTSGQRLTAKALLRDGRRISVPLTVELPRPRIELIGRNVASPVTAANAIALQPDEMMAADTLTFSVRTPATAGFGREQTLEIATLDGTTSTLLSQARGTIRLENAKVAVARFEPSKMLEANAFGALQVRSLANGIAGDWQPLIHLLRLPVLHTLRCPAAVGEPALSPQASACLLSGSELFLIEAVSASANFEQAVVLPEGFTGIQLAVPRPLQDGALYLRLRDRPGIVRSIRLEVLAPPGA